MLYYIFRFICNPQYVYYLLIYYYTFTFLYKSVSISLYLINYFRYLPSNYLYYYNSVNNSISNNTNNDNNDDNDDNDDNKDDNNDDNKEIKISLNNYDNKNKFILL